MRINITARHFKLSDELRDYTEKSVQRLKKYYEPIIDVDIVLSWEKRDRMAEINISVFGTILSAHERSEDMRKSVDRAVAKLERQLKKYKMKIRGFEHEKIETEQFAAKDGESLNSEGY
jgi:putative sigma-54 modulation protein